MGRGLRWATLAAILATDGHWYGMGGPHIRYQFSADRIAVDDFDETTGPLAQLWWQPDWRDEAHFPGSGTFRRPQK